MHTYKGMVWFSCGGQTRGRAFILFTQGQISEVAAQLIYIYLLNYLYKLLTLTFNKISDLTLCL